LKILIAGASGYIGSQLLPIFVEAGHDVVALVRSTKRLHPAQVSKVTVVEADLHSDAPLSLPHDIEVAYYLVHSMAHRPSGFAELEEKQALHFMQAIEKTQAKQIIYLSGLSKERAQSEHMRSRHRVEELLFAGKIPVTVLRAGIIIGAKSASFKIMYDLVRRLPVMVAPKWVRSYCQPIAIQDVLFYLQGVMLKKECMGQTFEIGGPDQLTYYEMLHALAKAMGKRRAILLVPVLTPYLSSLWLVLVTSVNFSIARALVHSLTVDAICSEGNIHKVLPHTCLDFITSVKKELS